MISEDLIIDREAREIMHLVVSVCPFVCVYSGYIMHHYNGIWGTCAPSGRNMHHQGAICTMVHKGDIPLRVAHTYEKLVVPKVPSYDCE